MTVREAPASNSSGSSFDDLIEIATKQLDAGQAVDVDHLTTDHPHLRGKMQEILPTLQAMATWGKETTTEFISVPGERLGDYQIVREIGRGGMGVVYEARQDSLGRRVALKLLPFASMLDPRRVQRFKQEAMAAARLDHPHIVNVYGVGCERGMHYYAMRYVDGQSLSHLIPRTAQTKNFSNTVRTDSRFPIAHPACPARESVWYTDETFERAVGRLGREISDALEHAHQQGIIHRDVKPANILVDSDGRSWITDFGLALYENDVSLTRTGELVGTLRYMSPEQLSSPRSPVDHRTDIYSLGATLYELLTRRPAFASTDRSELIRQIVFDEPVRPRHWNRQISDDLETIVLKAMAKLPCERYESAREFSDDLARFLQDQPIRARRPTIGSRFRRWLRRHNRLAWTIAAAGSLFVLSALIILSVANSRIRAERSRTREAMLELQESERLAERRAVQIGEELQRIGESQRWLERGRWSTQERHWDDAWNAYTKAIELRPENADGWIERARLCTRLGLWEHATTDFERAHRLGEPDVANRWYQLALLYLSTGRQDAYQQLRLQMQSRFAGSLDPMMVIELVRTWSIAPTDPRESAGNISRVQRVLESNPNLSLGYYILGLAQLRDGQFEASIEASQRSLEIDPHWPARALNYPVLAMAHARLGQMHEAQQALKLSSEALRCWTQDRLHPSDKKWIVHQGATGAWPVSWSDWLECRYLHQEASLLLGEPMASADEISLHVLRARALAGLRWHDEADREYAAALALEPSEPIIRAEYHRNRGAWRTRQEDWTQAAREYAIAASMDPEDALLPCLVAVTHFLAGNQTEYELACDRLLERFGSTSDPYIAVNTVYACALSARAPANEPQLGQLADTGRPFWHAGTWAYGAALYRTGDLAAAVKCLEDGAHHCRLRAWDYCFLAMAQQRLGNVEQATQSLCQAEAWTQAADQPPHHDPSKTTPAWNDELERAVCQRLLQETRQLVFPHR